MITRCSLILLLLLAFAAPARAQAVTLFYQWSYPDGVTIDPSRVTIDLTGGDAFSVRLGTHGGSVAFTNPYGRSCYRITIHADTRVYASTNDSECFRMAIPLVTNGEHL